MQCSYKDNLIKGLCTEVRLILLYFVIIICRMFIEMAIFPFFSELKEAEHQWNCKRSAMVCRKCCVGVDRFALVDDVAWNLMVSLETCLVVFLRKNCDKYYI